jgi:hypothetical protein
MFQRNVSPPSSEKKIYRHPVSAFPPIIDRAMGIDNKSKINGFLRRWLVTYDLEFVFIC